MEDSPCGRVVLTDASVLINFLHLGRLDLLNSQPGYVFMVPDHVLEEISDPKQRERLETGIRSGFLTILSITDLEEIESYAQFHRTLGQGESACLAVALRRGYFVASDERGVFRRTSTAAIGRERILTTPDILVLAIRVGLATVDDADGWKAILEANRFKMRFSSFREIPWEGLCSIEEHPCREELPRYLKWKKEHSVKYEEKLWGWKEGSVDPEGEHIQIRYQEDPEPVALVGNHGGEIVVQFAKGSSPGGKAAVRRELDHYFVELKELNPWAYAISHCSTAANIYSKVRWGYYPGSLE